MPQKHGQATSSSSDKPRIKHGKLRGKEILFILSSIKKKKIPAKEKMKKMLFPLQWSIALCNRSGEGGEKIKPRVKQSLSS